MNTHKNARLTYARRIEMVRDVVERGMTPCAAAAAQGVSAPTARKWLGRYLAAGQAGLVDRSSRPARSPRSIASGKALAIVELRRRCLTQARIAQALGVSGSTVSRVLARAGLSKLRDLAPAEPVIRYERETPGELLHIERDQALSVHFNQEIMSARERGRCLRGVELPNPCRHCVGVVLPICNRQS